MGTDPGLSPCRKILVSSFIIEGKLFEVSIIFGPMED